MNRPTLSRGGRRGGGSSALLQKANAQLRGQKVPRPAQEDNDEEDIGAYLSSLSRKTKEPQWDKFGETSDIDISISSDDQEKKAAPVTTTSKFLKKKAEPIQSKNDPKFIKQPKAAGTGPSKVGSSVLASKSSALNKAAAFVSKFSDRPKQNVAVDLSDSDLDMDLSMDSDIIADVHAMKHPAPKTVPKQTIKKVDPKPSPSSKPMTKTTPAKAPSKRVPSPAQDDDSISIGINGSKFAQKATSKSGYFDISDSSVSDGIGKGGSKFLKKKPKAESPPPRPREEVKSPDSPKRQSMFRLKSADKYATQVMLDTDEESLADFIGGLSSSTDPGSARTPRTPKSPVSARQTASKYLKPKLSPVGRPSPEPAIDTIREVEEPSGESAEIVSEKESSIEEESFKIKVFDLDDLEPAIDPTPAKSSKPSSKRSSSKSKSPRSPKEKSRKKDQKETKKKATKDKKSQGSKAAAASNSFFSSFGLQTVDDLLGGGVDEDEQLSAGSDVPSEVVEEVYDGRNNRSPTPLRSILSPTPRSHTPRRVRLSLSEVLEVRSPSPEPVSTARAVTSRIYTEDFEVEEDYSESAVSIRSSSEEESVRTLTESGRSSPSRSRRSSLSRQRSDEYYSDDFTETSATSRRGYAYSTSTRSDDSSDTGTYSEDYTSYVSGSRSPSPRSRPVTRSVRVQTSEVPGLWYSWDPQTAGMAGQTPPIGLGHVDPVPIATHVVSADALETLTAYSPSMLVLNDMLRQQLQLTQEFAETQRRMYKAYVGSSVPDHNYTTLQGTKEYIAKHRKPKLTFDEALRQVKEEMGLS